jgi:hypothetical protein
MEKKERIINWIGVALSQDPNSLTEAFYFDRSEQRFFSIHFLDYFMLDEDLDINPAANISYSEETQQEIVGWIRRIENKDNSILRLPQKGLIDEKLKEIEALQFINEKEIDIESAKIWEVESNVSVGFDLAIEDEKKQKGDKKWWEFWK